jgi:acyl-CoA reductase-like NAD-dependent aldehyde dehydrogenase
MAQVDTSVPVRELTVAGKPVTTDETRVVRSPWDGAAIAAVPVVGAQETERAVAAAA